MRDGVAAADAEARQAAGDPLDAVGVLGAGDRRRRRPGVRRATCVGPLGATVSWNASHSVRAVQLAEVLDVSVAP